VAEPGVLSADSFCAGTALLAGVLHASSQVAAPRSFHGRDFT